MNLPESELRHRNQLIRSLLDQLEERFPGSKDRAAFRAVLAVATAERLGIDDLLRIRCAAELAEIGRLLVDSDQHSLFADEALPAETFLQSVIEIIRHQAERYDGSGFPSGLAGGEIPIGSRILAACNAYVKGEPGDGLDPTVEGELLRIAQLVQPIGT